jgi:hypothetical protein
MGIMTIDITKGLFYSPFFALRKRTELFSLFMELKNLCVHRHDCESPDISFFTTDRKFVDFLSGNFPLQPLQPALKRLKKSHGEEKSEKKREEGKNVSRKVERSPKRINLLISIARRLSKREDDEINTKTEMILTNPFKVFIMMALAVASLNSFLMSQTTDDHFSDGEVFRFHFSDENKR